MSRDVCKLFAIKLKALREERLLTQEALALKCNIDRTHIGRIEKLKRKPGLEVLEKIAVGLDMELKDLMDF